MSNVGPRSVAVPGEILGYWEAKQRLGNPDISWSSLILPSIDLCEKGIPVTGHAAMAMSHKKEDIFRDPGMRRVFIDPATNDTWREGDTYKRPALAKTLKRVAENGAGEFYTGQTGKAIVKDLKKAGGIITEQDLKNYKCDDICFNALPATYNLFRLYVQCNLD